MQKFTSNANVTLRLNSPQCILGGRFRSFILIRWYPYPGRSSKRSRHERPLPRAERRFDDVTVKTDEDPSEGGRKEGVDVAFGEREGLPTMNEC